LDAHQVVNSIYKKTEDTRVQARAATEIFEQLQFIAESTTFSNEDEQQTFFNGLELLQQLALFGFTSAKSHEQEARDITLKALSLPPSLRHLETSDESARQHNAFNQQEVEAIFSRKFEHNLLRQQFSNSQNGFRGRGYPLQSRGGLGRTTSRYNLRGSYSFNNRYQQQQSFHGRGRGQVAPFPQQQTSTSNINAESHQYLYLQSTFNRNH
jgi:hypothetical protein